MPPLSESLLAMIRNLLDNEWTLGHFRARYYEFYLDIPDDGLDPYDDEFFGLVHERLDWTADQPDPLSRSYGWMTPDEYVEWLRQAHHEYLLGRP